MQEGALRAYHLLAPLLALRPPRNAYLHQALAGIHVVLGGLANLVQESLHRQEHTRALAARAGAAVTYHLLRLSDEVCPDMPARPNTRFGGAVWCGWRHSILQLL